MINLIFAPTLASTDNQDSYENDNTLEQAVSITLDDNIPQHHNFHHLNDEDWVKFDGISGKTYYVELTRLETHCYLAVEVYNSQDMKQITLWKYDISGNPVSADSCNFLSWTGDYDGVYYIRLHRYDPTLPCDNTSYDLRVKTFCPDIYEPDDTMEQADSFLPADFSQPHNFHVAGDRDWIKFYGNSGQNYTVELIPLGADCDAVIELYDADGGKLTQDTTGQPSADKSLSWVSQEDKSYYVSVRHKDPNVYGSETAYQVSLTISHAGEAFSPDSYEDDDDVFEGASVIRENDLVFQYHNFHDAGDNDWVRFEGKAGTTYIINAESLESAGIAPVIELYEIRADGITLLYAQSNKVFIFNALKYYSEKDSVYYVKTYSHDPQVYGMKTGYNLWLEAYFPDVYDDDNALEWANVIIPGYEIPQQHNFHAPGDEDWVKFYGIAGETYIIDANILGQNADVIVELYDSEGMTPLRTQNNPDDPLASESLDWECSADGIYYIRINNSSAETYGDGMDYELSLTRDATGVVPSMSGSVEGSVTDAYSGSPIEGVRLRTGAGLTALSSDSGDYLMVLHPPGNYTITAEFSDYEVFDDSIDVNSGESVHKDIKMVPKASTVAAPIFFPNSGTFYAAQKVSLSCATSDAVIHYTTDGSEPTEASQVYSTPIIVSETLTIKARAYKTNWGPSDVVSGVYIITGTVAMPEFSIEPGTYTMPQYVELSCSTPDAIIRYTTDGSEPSQSSLIYANPISVSSSMTIKAKAFKVNWNSSSTATGIYTITGTVAMPEFSPEPGIYVTSQQVELSCSTPDAIIRYTTDGSEPSENSSVYVNPIPVSSSMTIKAKAFRANWNSSSTATGIYTITGTVSVPDFLPEPGIYATSQQVVLSCSTPDAIIRYTTDGSEPSENSSVYTNPILVSSSMTIKAKAFRANWNSSSTATGIYTITGTVAMPEFSPEPGIYSESQNVELTCSTPDAVIRYTADGSEPSENSSVYANPIPVSSGVTIKAKAFKANWNSSSIATGIYTITGTVAMPEFSPEPGIYAASQQVVLSCSTPDAIIRYTTDGSEPSENSSVYTNPILVSSSMTIKAKAFKANWNSSSIATGSYTITGTVAMPEFSPESGIYAESQNVKLLCSTPDAVIRYTTDGREPSENSSIYTNPILVSSSMTIKAKAFKANWNSSSTATGIYIITGTVAMPEFSPEPGVYAESQNVILSCSTPDAVIRYTTDGSEPSENSSVYANPISVSSSMTIKAKAFKENWNSSPTATGTYAITGTVSAPEFSPEPGIYAESQNVKLSCSTQDAIIRYTADGSEPSENSSVYTNPIPVSSGMTIKAKAFKTNWNSSSTATGIYTITGTAAMPEFSPEPGTYTTAQQIELSCSMPGVMIHYTTDGSEPTEYSRLYTEPILISATTTIRAKAFKTDWQSSDIATGIYTIIQTVESPVFAPESGIYITTQTIELSCLTPDAVIHYTIDGSEPAEYSPVYTSSISVSETMTIKAKAFKTGWIASSTAASTYTITGTVAAPDFSLPPDVYTSPQTVELSCATPGASVYYTTDGTEPSENSPCYTSSISVSETMTIKAKAFKTDWEPSITITQHYIIDEIESPDSGGGACFLSSVIEH